MDGQRTCRQTDRDCTRAKSSASMALWQMPYPESTFAITLLAQSGNSMFQSNNSSINRSRVFRIETQRKQAGLAGNFAAGQVGNKEGRHRRSLAYLSVEADKSRMQRRISSSDSFSFPLSVFFVCSGVKNGKCNTTLTGVQGRQSGMQRTSTDFQNAAL